MPKYWDACQTFFMKHGHVDVGVRGEGEHTAVELLRVIAEQWDGFDPETLETVQGISYRGRSSLRPVMRTTDRSREPMLDGFPSPYLSNVFDAFENVPDVWSTAILETNRGCPYGCTFCDWGSATLQKIYQFSFERIASEIEWMAAHKVSVLWIADANFGIFDRDIAITDLICQSRREYGYPRQVIVNYAKNATSRLAEIIRRLRQAQLSASGIISIQTYDRGTLANINRANIKTERYEELIEVFRRERLPVSSDLMIGLPGATVESFKNDLQFFIDRQVHIVAYPVRVLPNSPMGDRAYLDKYKIVFDGLGYIVSSSSFTRLDLSKMRMLFGVYRGAIWYSILKYMLYYLQVDHGVQAADFLQVLLEQLQRKSAMPRSHTIFMRHVLAENHAALLKVSEEEWREMYAEVLDLAGREFAFLVSSTSDAIVTAQLAVLPRHGRLMPDAVWLQHDVAAYFDQFSRMRSLHEIDRAQLRRLESFPQAELHIVDPDGICDGQWIPPVDRHRADGWELMSELTSLGTCA